MSGLPQEPGPAGGPPVRSCSVKAPVSLPILRRAASGEARKKMLTATQQRCVANNGPLLDELLRTRHDAATRLGFASHAERMLASKMARTPERAYRFCEEMLERLAPLRDAELGRMRTRKAAGSNRADSEAELQVACPGAMG